MKKKLPKGISNLREIINDGYVYDLATTGKYYFLSLALVDLASLVCRYPDGCRPARAKGLV